MFDTQAGEYYQLNVALCRLTLNLAFAGYWVEQHSHIESSKNWKLISFQTSNIVYGISEGFGGRMSMLHTVVG